MRAGPYSYLATAFQAVNESLPHGVMVSILRGVTSMPRWICQPVADLSSWPGPRQLPYFSAAESGVWVRHPDDTEGEADIVLFYIHGGVYRLGGPMMHPHLFVGLIDGLRERGVKARIFSVDYTLAPAKHPTQLDECVAAYRLLQAHCQRSRLMIGGDSLGAALALATLFRLEILGVETPASLIMLSPWLDMDPNALVALPSYALNKSKDFLNAGFVRLGVADALEGVDLKDPTVSPAYATDAQLAHLPPGYVAYGTHEILQSSIDSFVERLRATGKRWEVDTQPGGHDWMCSPTYAGDPSMCRDACLRMAAWMAGQVASGRMEARGL